MSLITIPKVARWKLWGTLDDSIHVHLYSTFFGVVHFNCSDISLSKSGSSYVSVGCV